MGSVRVRDRAATEARILAAARRLFAQAGYDRVSVRAIATAADANPALISRYFGSKQQLFAETVVDAFDLRQLLEGPLPELPERLAEFALRRRTDSGNRALLEALNRSSSVPEVRSAVAARIDAHFVEPLARLLVGADARERALVATALLNGVGAQRRSLGARGLSDDRGGSAERVLTRAFASALGLPS